MGLTKTEINLRRLLAAMPHQTNQAKLAQYIVTLKEQLAVLTGESGQGNLPCISPAKAKEYAEQIELAAQRVDTSGMQDIWEGISVKDPEFEISEVRKVSKPSNLLEEGQPTSASSGLRKRLIASNEASSSHSAPRKSTAAPREDIEKHGMERTAPGSSVKVDSATFELIEKHRHLQENLTDEMVDLARQMKEASLSMNRAVLDSEKVLDSTEQGIEHSLASTNQANKRAQYIYSRSFKTGCVTWLVIFVMTCMFLLMVFLIRIT